MTPAPFVESAGLSHDQEVWVESVWGHSPIDIVDELPAACRNRKTITIARFGDNASPMLEIRNNYTIIVSPIASSQPQANSNESSPKVCTTESDAYPGNLPWGPRTKVLNPARSCSRAR